MKKVIAASIITIMSVVNTIAQPLPNQNPYGNASASTSAPTTGSISTLSVDHNQIIMVGLSLLAVAAIYFISKKKAVKA